VVCGRVCLGSLNWVGKYEQVYSPKLFMLF
jgi:hypothetical protein